MDKARIAENLLSIVADRSRASAMTGDLLETSSRTGTFTFCFALTRIFLALAWRPIAAFAAAVLTGFSVSIALFVAASRHLFLGQVHEPTLLFHAQRLADVSRPLSVLAVFSCLRFGLRDSLGRISTVYACLTAALVYSFWVPHVQAMLSVAMVASIVLCLSTDTLRRASTVIAAALVVALLTQSAIDSIIHTVVLHHWAPNRFLAWYLLPALSLAPAAELIICGLLRKHLFHAATSAT